MSDAVTEVSFDTCHRELIENGGDEARRVYHAWRSRMEQQAPYQEVVSFVEGFTHRFLFTITQEMLESVVRRSDHALGKLKKEEVQDKRIEDFDTPFALHHLFHRFMEEQSLVPTWQDWWTWLTQRAGKRFYVHPVQKAFAWERLKEADREHLRNALQWRLEKFYYSAFRELELFTALRVQHGLPVKYHLLADVLRRADLWMGNAVVSLFFENSVYRAGSQGRKHRAQDFFGAGFRFPEVTIRRQGFGTFWRPRSEDIALLAEQLKAGSVPMRSGTKTSGRRLMNLSAPRRQN